MRLLPPFSKIRLNLFLFFQFSHRQSHTLKTLTACLYSVSGVKMEEIVIPDSEALNYVNMQGYAFALPTKHINILEKLIFLLFRKSVFLQHEHNTKTK